MILRSLPEDKASFGLVPLSTFWQFVTKSVFDNPATFVSNRRYRYVREVEINLLRPWANRGYGRWRRIDVVLSRGLHALCTTVNDGHPHREKFNSAISASPGSSPLAHAANGAPLAGLQVWPWVWFWGEREMSFREIERENKGEIEQKREGGRREEREEFDGELCGGLGRWKWRSSPGRPSIGRDEREGGIPLSPHMVGQCGQPTLF